MKIDIETVHENPWFKVTKEEFIRHDGKPCTFYVVNKQEAVFVIPFSKDGSIYMVKQYRHATRTWGWEVPAGGSDGEQPILAAKRELQEETGLVAAHWEQAATIHLTPGISNNNTYIFVARNLTQTADNTQEDEGIVACKRFSIPEIKDMIISGEIHDAPTIASLARVLWMGPGFMGS
jgi:8-oxo-dGTP pyrophosphatase MutT (NUDIX family)